MEYIQSIGVILMLIHLVIIILTFFPKLKIINYKVFRYTLVGLPIIIVILLGIQAKLILTMIWLIIGVLWYLNIYHLNNKWY